MIGNNSRVNESKKLMWCWILCWNNFFFFFLLMMILIDDSSVLRLIKNLLFFMIKMFCLCEFPNIELKTQQKTIVDKMCKKNSFQKQRVFDWLTFLLTFIDTSTIICSDQTPILATYSFRIVSPFVVFNVQ